MFDLSLHFHKKDAIRFTSIQRDLSNDVINNYDGGGEKILSSESYLKHIKTYKINNVY